MQTRRTEWAERVGQWRRSGLTAKEFAHSVGVNVGTLTYWAWRLGRERRVAGQVRPRPRAGRIQVSTCESAGDLTPPGSCIIC